MRDIGTVFLSVAGALILSLADLHATGVGFGANEPYQDGLPALLMGAACGGLAALAVLRQVKRRLEPAVVSERVNLSRATSSWARS